MSQFRDGDLVRVCNSMSAYFGIIAFVAEAKTDYVRLAFTVKNSKKFRLTPGEGIPFDFYEIELLYRYDNPLGDGE